VDPGRLLLSTAVLTPILRRAGDIFGKDRMLTAVMLALSGGTLICAVATSLPIMLLGRAVQGAGGAIYPLAFGIVRDEFPTNGLPAQSGSSHHRWRSAPDLGPGGSRLHPRAPLLSLAVLAAARGHRGHHSAHRALHSAVAAAQSGDD
jgi:MFS family permease